MYSTDIRATPTVMQWSLGLVVGALVLVDRSWADDCSPPSPGEKTTPPWECCEFDALPENVLEDIKKCREKHPLPDHPHGPPPSATVKAVMACSTQCVFEEGGFLTADKTIDKDAVTKLFSKALDGDEGWDSVMPKVLDKCFSSYSTEVDKSLECKSGAIEFETCVMREVFLTCPKKSWSDKEGCASLRDKVSKCPKVPVMIMKPQH